MGKCEKIMRMFDAISKRKVIAVHNGSFHADDVFACATLLLRFKNRCRIIRTRDEEIIKKADFVVDVGGVYDPEKNRFDHHQKGGAGEREDGIPYASFGLVWKKFGMELCEGNAHAMEIIDKKIAEPIDGPDNGVSVSKSNVSGIYDYEIHHFFAALKPTWKEDKSRVDQGFKKAVEIARTILEREVKGTLDYLEEEKIIVDTYENSKDKRLLVFSEPFPRFEIVKIIIENNMPEVLFAVYPDQEEHNWRLVAVRKTLDDFALRKDFPESWAGLDAQSLSKITGVTDAIFCHRNRFLASAKSKEGALKLAELALND